MILKKLSNSFSTKSFFFLAMKLLRTSRYRKSFLLFFCIAIPSVFIFSLDDQQAIQLYVDKLQQLSIHTLSQRQKVWIQNFYLNDHNDTPIKAERQRTRHSFNRKKKKIIREWEAYYNLKWPQMKITKNHNFATINFEAHHVIPINAGGINIIWNISPLSSKNHKLLHESIEEKACFSHDYLHRKFIRFILNIKIVVLRFLKPYINQKGTNYAHNV